MSEYRRQITEDGRQSTEVRGSSFVVVLVLVPRPRHNTDSRVRERVRKESDQIACIRPACRAIVTPERDDDWRRFLFSAFRIPTSEFLTGVREDAVPTNYSNTIFGVFGAEQILNYKHQILNGSVRSKVEGLTTLSQSKGKSQIPILNDQNTGIENKSY